MLYIIYFYPISINNADFVILINFSDFFLNNDWSNDLLGLLRLHRLDEESPFYAVVTKNSIYAHQ